MKRLIKVLYLKCKLRHSCISISSNISRDCKIAHHVKILARSHLGSVQVGKYSYIGEKAIIERAIIGSFCSVAREALIGLGSHPTNYVSTYPGFYSPKVSGSHYFGHENYFNDRKPVEIGHDVWIGARAIILGGVKIGTGAIIAAGSIVTKDVPPYAIIGGVPGKIIRFRFDQEICRDLLASKWWDFDKQKLEKLAPSFSSPEAFLKKLG